MNILVIPDTQIRPDNLALNAPLLLAIGELIVERKPDAIVHLGDHFDFFSLNQYDMKKRNKVVFDGHELTADIKAGAKGLDMLSRAMTQYNAQQRANKKKLYLPDMHFCVGNHEQRLQRFPELRGLIGVEELFYGTRWQVHDFLKPVKLGGVHFVHYAYNPLSGAPVGGTAEYRLNKLKVSFVQGHEQTFKYHQEYLQDGRKISALIGGACYLHDEEYKGYQGNEHFRGCFFLHNVKDGLYDLEQISVERLLNEHA